MRVKHRNRYIEAILVQRELNKAINAVIQESPVWTPVELQNRLLQVWTVWVSNHPWLEKVYNIPLVFHDEEACRVEIYELTPKGSKEHKNPTLSYDY